MYKSVGEWVGGQLEMGGRVGGWVGRWVGCWRWVDGWAAGGWFYLLIGVFRVAMSPKSASHSLRDVSLKQGVNIRPISSMWCPPWAPMLSYDFTWSAKPTVKKHTSHLNLVMQQCTGGV